jgi:ComF family protein
MNTLVQALKYQHRLALAHWFGGQMAAQWTRSAEHGEINVVVPMPLHPARLKERGFNQAVEIGRPLAAALGLAIDVGAASRCRPTRPQEGLSRRERQGNLRGAFLVAPGIDGKRVLIIDDVMTTGASANELARSLVAAGAIEVSVGLVCRADRG